MKIQNCQDRRKSKRIPIIKRMGKTAKMYLSPPLIMDPVPVILNELSSGGMKLFTENPIPTRFLFAIVFSAPFAKKIYAEAKILHVTKVPDGFSVGASFINIKPEMQERIDNIAEDYTTCEDHRKTKYHKYCISDECRYFPICTKKWKKRKRRVHAK